MPARTMMTNEKGHLLFAGCDTVSLAKHYGTPLYVMDEAIIRANMRACTQAMAKRFDRFSVYYASKAGLFSAMVHLCLQEGLRLDVVSLGELMIALNAGMTGEDIALHGNVKTQEEIRLAVAQDCLIVIDSLMEIEDIARESERQGKTTRVMVRITPGVEAHTHEYIQTGILDCKFSLGVEDGQALKALQCILDYPQLKLLGLHCHIGSQIIDPSPYYATGVNMAKYTLMLEEQCGVTFEALTLGGGFGVTYTEQEVALPVEAYIEQLARGVHEVYGQANRALPAIQIEPGRFIVGEAGMTLYTAYVIKDIPGVRTYVSVDGGMSDNPRPMLYQARYDAVVANRPQAEAHYDVHLAGRCCETGDVLIENLPLPKVERGDTIAVFSTGAYNYAMASNYNRLPIPAVVMAHEGRSSVVVPRQDPAAMMAGETIPDYWKA